MPINDFITKFGYNRYMVIAEFPKIFDESYCFVTEQVFRQVGFMSDRMFKLPLLQTKPTQKGPIFSNRTYFLTKAEATKQGRPCIQGAYPTDEIVKSLEQAKTTIRLLKPKAIIALGALPLWTLTGNQSIEDWRGSELFYHSEGNSPIPVLATYSPFAAIGMEEFRFDMLRDLNRLKSNLHTWGKFQPSITVPTSYKEAKDHLNFLQTQPLLVNDLETQAYSQITCIGFGYSPNEAIVIPLLSKEYPLGYYTLEEELDLILHIKALLTDKSKQIANQNYNYDRQWFARMYGFVANLNHDAMIAQAVLYPGQPKDLAYLSSHYCKHHVFWKNLLKEWKTSKAPDSSLFYYNGVDCVRTFEILQRQLELLEQRNLQTQYQQQITFANITIKIMLRGINPNKELILQSNGTYLPIQDTLRKEVKEAIEERASWLKAAVPLQGDWYNSDDKLKELCYGIFGLTPIIKRKTNKPTTDKNALPKLMKQEPILKPILSRVLELHSLQIALNVINTKPDWVDGRYHTELTVCGTKTFRYASHSDAFNFGGNSQNISSGKDLSEKQ